jgi:hypothetical protein
VPAYGTALYTLPAVGRTSAPVRVLISGHPNEGGYDVILWTDVVPAKDMTHDELVTAMFTDLRRAYFAKWVDQIAHDLHIRVDIDLSQLAEGGS